MNLAVRHADRSAFTLIELLIVMAVIGILIGLMVPMIGAIRGAANTTKCLASQRQLGLATLAYATDYKRYPAVHGADDRHWYDYIGPYLESALNDRRTIFRECPVVKDFTQAGGFSETTAWGGYGMNVFHTKENFTSPGPTPWAMGNYDANPGPLFKFAPPALGSISFPSNRILTADSGSWSLEPGSSHLIQSIANIPANSSDPIFVINGLTNIYDRHRGRRVVASYYDGRSSASSFRKTYCALVAPDLLDSFAQ